MNKRINEMFEQAVAKFNAKHKYATINVPVIVIEKFAELIVKDCADCIRENYNHESAESIAFQMEIKYGLHTDYGDHS